MIGRMSRSEFLVALARLEGTPDVSLRRHYRIQQLKMELEHEFSPDSKELLYGKLTAATLEVEGDEAAPTVARLQAKLVRLGGERGRMLDLLSGARLESDALNAMGAAAGRASVGAGPCDRSSELAAQGALASWSAATKETLDEAIALGHPLLIADALSLRLVATILLLFRPFMDAARGGVNLTVSAEERELALRVTDGRRPNVMNVRVRFHEALLVKASLADFYEMIGDRDKAIVISKEILPIADALQYGDIIQGAKDCLEDRSIIAESFRGARARESEDRDIRLANETDENLRQVAEFNARISDLGPERIPVIERMWHVSRRAAQERLQWCRHVKIIQHEEQEALKGICCVKFGYGLTIVSPLIDPAILQFRIRHCYSCWHRDPKERVKNGNAM